MGTHFELVAEFNRNILGIGARPLGIQPENEAKLSVRQLMEEAEEMALANSSQDFVGVIDSAIDSIYFAYGILYKLGLDNEKVDRIFNSIHNYNMTKKRGVKSGREGFDAADAVKPTNFVMSPEERIMHIISEG